MQRTTHDTGASKEPSPDVEASVVEVARRLADEVLFPAAQAVDRDGQLPASHLRALAEAGLFDLSGLAATDARRVLAAVAGGCGATFFVWAQHHGVVRTLGTSPNERLRDELLARLLAGDMIAGVAFAHVRRRGAPAVRASRVAGGWQLDGVAPWATSWGIAEHFCVAAETEDAQMVWTMLPGEDARGFTAELLELSVFGATGTVALRFDRCIVTDAAVVQIEDANQWRTLDRRRSSLGAPAVLGVAERAIRVLRESTHPDDGDAHRAADRLGATLAELWAGDDRWTTRLASLADVSDRDVAAASDHRAACLDLGARATRALLAGTGGRGMDLGHPAQRLAREAAFYVIQAQTTDGRAATLRST